MTARACFRGGCLAATVRRRPPGRRHKESKRGPHPPFCSSCRGQHIRSGRQDFRFPPAVSAVPDGDFQKRLRAYAAKSPAPARPSAAPAWVSRLCASMGAAIVEQNAHNAAFPAGKRQQALNLGGKRQARATGTHHQQNRQLQCVCHMPCAGSRPSRRPHRRKSPSRPRSQLLCDRRHTGHTMRRKARLHHTGTNPDCDCPRPEQTGETWGRYNPGPHLNAHGAMPPFFQRGQQRAGHRRFAAAGGRRGQHTL